MKKLAILSFSLIALSFFAALPVQALTLVINDRGIQMYEGEVLGEQDVASSSSRSAVGRREEPRKPAPAPTKTPTPKVVKPTTEQIIRLRQEAEKKARILLEERKTASSSAREKKPTEPQRKPAPKEEFTTESIRVEMPAKLKNETREREELPEAVNAAQFARREREEREDETVEVKSEASSAAQERRFEIRSRDVSAQAEGAEMVIDPTTNELSVVTPSGIEHTLNHLPDQALENIRRIRATENDELTADSLNVETTEDGRVVYRARAERTKHLLGIFERKVQTEVELDDSTGDVVERELAPQGAFARFLNFLTF